MGFFPKKKISTRGDGKFLDLKLEVQTDNQVFMMSTTNLFMGDNSNTQQRTAIIFAGDLTSSLDISPSDFIWDFRKLPFPSHLGKYFIKIGKISAKINEIGTINAIFELGMTPI